MKIVNVSKASKATASIYIDPNDCNSNNSANVFQCEKKLLLNGIRDQKKGSTDT